MRNIFVGSMGVGIITVVIGLLAAAAAAGTENGGAEMFSAELMHMFSEEMNAVRASRLGREVGEVGLPSKRSPEFHRILLSSDLERQKMKMAPQSQYLHPSQGVLQLGNEFGWLHYTWMDVGSPNVSFLVALDTGSDLFWLPCNCMQCAPLSASHYGSLDKDLKEYNPSGSNTSKFIKCNHQLCELGSRCRSPEEQCPYTANYNSVDTSTSGFLVQDILHLQSASSNKSNKFVRAPVVIGCGSKQSGSYLMGIAPDGVMGLGLGNISVPHFLAKDGLVRNSFSLCFDEDSDGRIYFGDQGIASQNTTTFLALDDRNDYVIGVNACCIGTSCIEQPELKVLVDSGTSFTYLPSNVYEKLVGEFDRQINATKTSFGSNYPWEYCYKSSSLDSAKIPSISFKFDGNNSFLVLNPVFIVPGTEDPVGFCLPISPIDDNLGTFGQNFMTGYRMVFDGENMRLGWSRSDCQGLADDKTSSVSASNGSSPGTLPTVEQQSSPKNTPPSVPVLPSIANSIFMEPGQLSFAEFMFPWLAAFMFVWIF